MKKILLCLFLGTCISNLSGIYCRVKFEKWTNSHPKTIGMPDSWDLKLFEFIERPIETILEVNNHLIYTIGVKAVVDISEKSPL